MDLAASDVDLLCQPTGAFVDIEDYLHRINTVTEGPKDQSLLRAFDVDSNSPLHQSRQNGEHNGRWRLDGIDCQGTQIYIVPLFIHHPAPKRIDLFIPPQHRYSPGLRESLDAAWAFCIRDSRVNTLGIAEYVITALEHWTNAIGPDAVERLWTDAPFGSRLVLDRISASVFDTTIRFVKEFDVERQMLSFVQLQSMWKLPHQDIPDPISLDELRLLGQLHDTVSLVMLPTSVGGKKAIFKSSLHDVKYMYHELKLLLTMRPHVNVMSKPWHLVTVKDRYGGDDKTVGFILPFYEQGNLADIVSYRKGLGTLELKDQFRWAMQIVVALRHVKTGPAKFYSELKADNLLLDNDDNVVLIDFEQMGNWATYSAPEIHYVEYCKRLSKSPHVPAAEQKRYKAILESHVGLTQDPDPTYDNPVNGYYTAWTTLTPEEQEAAEVFSLGMALWCIFEGCADTRNSVLKAFRYDSEQEFPEFWRSPNAIRKLIYDCTQGFRNSDLGRTRIIRINDKVYPRGRSGVNGEPTGTALEAAVAAQQMWKERVAAMETFLDAKARWKRGERNRGDEQLLGFMNRPKLQEVQHRLFEIQAGISQ
ncbi:hypothetical protein EJ05DRAFT_496635 [Pseudovirgaria hyperparasitica]|uniref:Protein kinase domain-containing protein n=1 Tax=Pseudovirgaria hyperparasitica TaxID=470096 RepID=A0A6A6WI08_9PEZI|nr:uncharacterized protein EJ05DRAFT_496635 [Pseudovirgaria hyperparasitica]KAF2761735.1 hypothetical protein EJ05DRAFT_496635 [Pseudovirgaria hyperparasitica]